VKDAYTRLWQAENETTFLQALANYEIVVRETIRTCMYEDIHRFINKGVLAGYISAQVSFTSDDLAFIQASHFATAEKTPDIYKYLECLGLTWLPLHWLQVEKVDGIIATLFQVVPHQNRPSLIAPFV